MKLLSGDGPILLAWVNYRIPSENKLRYRHWTIPHREAKRAQAAVSDSMLHSYLYAGGYWTTTTWLPGLKPFETHLQNISARMTRTSPGSTTRSLPKVRKAP